jgi:hypothetical protein
MIEAICADHLRREIKKAIRRLSEKDFFFQRREVESFGAIYLLENNSSQMIHKSESV